ncbi:MAG: hypothetical protein ACHQ4H_02685 [Ktedonobacterales bacterium]
MSSGYDGDERGGMPPGIEQLARRLDHDGATWRRALPDEARVAQRVVARLTPGAVAEMTPPATTWRDASDSGASGGGARPPRRTSGGARQRFLAVAAMLAVVLLLGALLLTFAPRQATPHPTATATTAATATLTPTQTPAFPGAWTTAGTVAEPPDVAFAPSDPRVGYLSATESTGVLLRRTDDAGKNWTSLPLPPGLVVDNHLIQVQAQASPLDAHTVFLFSARQGGTSACGAGADRGPFAAPRVPAAPLPSGATCLAQYRSTDGGASWQTVALPAPGVLWSLQAGSNSTLYADIYAPLYGSGVLPAGRLALSTDGGATWTLIDGTFPAKQVGLAIGSGQGASIHTFAVQTGGGRVWMITQSTDPSTQLPPYTQHYQLWSTADAGANWKLLGDTPGGASDGLLASGADLYLNPSPTGAAKSLAASLPQVSTDGGRTWSQPPTVGLGADFTAGEAFPAALGDGTIIMPLLEGNTRLFYAWKPGDAAWQQVAPALLLVHVEQIFTVTSRSTTTLWVLHDKTAGDDTTVESFTLR